jgi:exodeoxyribonuclease V alpha subunit
MKTINDLHQQFAEYFESEKLKPFIYLLSKKLKEGHICLSLDELAPQAEFLPPNYKFNLTPIEELIHEPLVSDGNNPKQPFIIYKNKMYLQRYFYYETLILNRLKQFVSDEAASYQARVVLLEKHKDFIEQLFRLKNKVESSEHNTDWQLAAALTGVLNNFSIITGGPGTGKTTTVAKILAILFKMNPALKVALAAPTGKAAARMAESLKKAELPVDESIVEKFQSLVPSTIHRLLKTNFGTHHFKHNKANPLNVDVVIIDESSMIDVAQFAKLLDAIGPGTRLLLLGDKDQLASVEAGSLFGDLCVAQRELNLFAAERSEFINSFISDPLKKIVAGNIIPTNPHPLFQHILELKVSHRFNSNEGIGKFSKAIIQNDEQELKSFFETGIDEMVTIDTDYNETIFNDFIKGYTSFIHETDTKEALKKLNNLRVLCAVREGANGLYAVNKRIEDWLQKEKLIIRSGEFYEHRPIMVTSNNYELGLFNGDVGIIRKNEKGIAMAWFENREGKIEPVLPGYITQAETVYAMTIHKSQGSEFDKVLMILPEKEDVQILTRELIYTGVTRAKKQVTVQGKREIILKAAAAQVKRASGIIERFIGQ